MKRFLLLGLATLLLISLVSIRPANAIPDCIEPINVCSASPDTCQPGWHCVSRQCYEAGIGILRNLCVPCQTEDCSDTPPVQTDDYASASKSVTAGNNIIWRGGVGSDAGINWGARINDGTGKYCYDYECVRNATQCESQGILSVVKHWACVDKNGGPTWFKCDASKDGEKLNNNNLYCCGKDYSYTHNSNYAFHSALTAENNLGTNACSDGSDNDCDGLTDCADSDCASDSACCTDPDTCQSACTAPNMWLSTAWNLWSGDSSSATGQHCCGDDGAEVYLEKKYAYATNWNNVQTQTGKDLCCKQATDCTSYVQDQGTTRGCYVEGAHLGTSTFNDGWICEGNVWYECNVTKLCQSKGGQTCFLDGTNYLWSASPPSESGSTECDNGLNDDCDANWDYDTMDRGAPNNASPHGDDGCPVSVTAAWASPTSVPQNGVVDVSCTSGIGVTDSIFAYRDDDNSNTYTPGTPGEVICSWNTGSGWAGSVATFKDCNVGSSTGTIAFRCSVYNGGAKPSDHAYMSGQEQEVNVTVTASSCSNHFDNTSCTGGSCCWIGGATYPTCNGSKWNGYVASSCIENSSCPPAYSCSVSKCSAQCDSATNIPTNGYCDAISCTPACNAGFTWNGTDCVAYVCTGTDPANAQLCTGDDTGLSADTPKSLVSSCSATKCEYTCNAGYELSGGVCVASAYSCTGPDPANATLCTNDDVGLSANTTKSLVANCSAPAGSIPKCEYTCNAGFTYNATSVQCDPVSGTYCGDGTVQTPNDNGENEQCDDGGASDGDGCNATCQWESCLDFFTGPSGGTCTNIVTDGYDLSWGAPVGVPSWSPLTKQVLRVDENLSEVNQGCPTPGDCEVKEDALAWTNSSYQAVGVLQPGTLYYNRVAAVCTDLNGTVEWRDTVWNCLTAGSVGNGNISGFVTDADTDDVIPGAVVTVVAPPPGYQDTTGSNGGYSLVDVPSGSRYVSASKPGYLAQSVLVSLVGGSVVQQNFSLSDGDCAQCADWEGRCTVECSGTDLCAATVPSACQGAKPGDSVWDPSQGSSGAYVTCCEGRELAYKVGAAEIGGCMDEVRKTTLLKRYRGGLYSIDVYTWKRCDQSS